jgi:hypothetical protein
MNVFEDQKKDCFERENIHKIIGESSPYVVNIQNRSEEVSTILVYLCNDFGRMEI